MAAPAPAGSAADQRIADRHLASVIARAIGIQGPEGPLEVQVQACMQGRGAKWAGGEVWVWGWGWGQAGGVTVAVVCFPCSALPRSVPPCTALPDLAWLYSSWRRLLPSHPSCQHGPARLKAPRLPPLSSVPHLP